MEGQERVNIIVKNRREVRFTSNKKKQASDEINDYTYLIYLSPNDEELHASSS